MQQSVQFEKTLKKNSTQKFSEEFSKYLKEQSISAAFNGCGIEPFSWYKKALGFSC